MQLPSYGLDDEFVYYIALGAWSADNKVTDPPAYRYAKSST